jgi:anti-sigma factor RsiW
MEARDLTCREIVELVTDYLEERLPADSRLMFEAHVSACPGCGNYLEQMRETVRLTGSLREDSLSPEVQRELLLAFRGWRRGLASGS